MSFSQILTRILWILPLALQAAVALVMLRRSLVGVFPIFFSYTVLVLFRETTLLFLPYPGNAYALIYWCGEALAVLLGLGVIFETIRHIFPPYARLKLVLRSVWLLACILAATALLMLIRTHGGAGTDRVLEAILLAERSARFLQASLLIVVIALISRLNLTWHHYSVGIVAGFGIYSAVALAVFEFRAHLHLLKYPVLASLNSAAYNVAAIIWAVYFLQSWRVTPVERLPDTNLSEWSTTIADYVDQWYRRS